MFLSPDTAHMSLMRIEQGGLTFDEYVAEFESQRHNLVQLKIVFNEQDARNIFSAGLDKIKFGPRLRELATDRVVKGPMSYPADYSTMKYQIGD
jgi:hypothetical protein